MRSGDLSAEDPLWHALVVDDGPPHPLRATKRVRGGHALEVGVGEPGTATGNAHRAITVVAHLESSGSGAMGKYFGRCFGVTPLSTRNAPGTIAASQRVRVPPGAEANRPTIGKETRTHDEPSFPLFAAPPRSACWAPP